MSPRERFSWLWVISLVLTYGVYFGVIGSAGAPLSPLTNVALLGAAVATQMAALGLFWTTLRRGDGWSERDERERLIEGRASSTAYGVLIVGMILVGCVLPLTVGGWDLVPVAVLAIVVAELVHHGLIIQGYRRILRA